MATPTYHGSCKCKQVTFEAEIDFAEGTHKCNCTWCFKHRECGVMMWALVEVTAWNPVAYY